MDLKQDFSHPYYMIYFIDRDTILTNLLNIFIDVLNWWICQDPSQLWTYISITDKETGGICSDPNLPLPFEALQISLSSMETAKPPRLREICVRLPREAVNLGFGPLETHSSVHVILMLVPNFFFFTGKDSHVLSSPLLSNQRESGLKKILDSFSKFILWFDQHPVPI